MALLNRTVVALAIAASAIGGVAQAHAAPYWIAEPPPRPPIHLCLSDEDVAQVIRNAGYDDVMFRELGPVYMAAQARRDGGLWMVGANRCTGEVLGAYPIRRKAL